MKKYIFLFILVLGIVIFGAKENVFAKEISKEDINIILLKGTNETKDGFPIYEPMDDNKIFMDIYNNTFIKESIELYKQAQQYSNLKSSNIYFAFKDNTGCEGKIGFYLKKDGQLYDMRKSPYIELSSRELKGNYDFLESITQLLPHEMGHILFGITTYDNDSYKSLEEKRYYQMILDYNNGLHYSNIITDYNTAFNEGFGEHFEIISRLYEQNKQVKDGINFNIQRTKNSTESLMESGNRDFLLPLRLGYYRETSIRWQQDYENLKRNELGLSGDGKYKNLSYEFSDPEKTILYRNMGLSQDKSKLRSLEQSLATESVNSNFFINLITNDTDDFDKKYSKVLNIFNKYVNKDNKPQLIQFVKGYIQEYPNDKERVLEVFKDSTGYDFTEQCAKEIWCVSDETHSRKIFDQFGSNKDPFYIFNINTCEKEDLLKLKGISKEEAEKIIEYRNKNNGFNDTNEFTKIEGLSDKAVEMLTNNTRQEKIQEALNNIEQSKASNGGVNRIVNFKHLSLMSLIWFIILFLVYYIFIAKTEIRDKKTLFKVMIKKFLKFALFVTIGFIGVWIRCNVFIGNRTLNQMIIFIIGVSVFEGITIFIIKRDENKIGDSLISTLIMMTIVLYSQY